jgi:hypothetical protein
MDLLISVVLGILLLVVLAVWIMSAARVGEQFLDLVMGVLGAPIMRLTRSISAARRERSIKKLPPGVPLRLRFRDPTNG